MTDPKAEETIFAAVQSLPSERRRSYLNQACRGDEALRQRIEALLKGYEASAPLENPVASSLDPGLTSPFLSERPGDRIGRYKILQQIGEGGCGIVYMAEQAEPVRRRVALKVIKLGMDTRQVIARFEAERQALALMDHPNIAKVLDAGATERGRPYFVMELVRGVKVTEYCDHNHLATNHRLELFVQVCRAIQHAHQKGIIHRDIKPSNILVTLHDGKPVPKVIDFGIAKATQGRLTDLTLFTAFEQFIGTPAYTSPEQAEISGLDIDTRSDIYSLGVLLYEMLTGMTPFDGQALLASGLDAMRRTILEQEPVRPSSKLSTMAEGELTRTARRRQTEAPKLLAALRGDLDWIVMKCLEKDRSRRYETANGLACDIERHLAQEPVTACPPGKLYRFQKMVRRNRLAFGASALIALSLLVGFGVSTSMYFRERAAEREQARLRFEAQTKEQKAQTEAAKSRQVAQFLKDMLNGVGRSVALGRDTAMLKEILDKTGERVGKDLANQPEVEAQLRQTIGTVYNELGQYEKAEQMHRAALAIQRSLFGNENLEVATSLQELGVVLWHEGKLPEAELVDGEALAIRRKLLGNKHPDVGRSLYEFGRLHRSFHRPEEAEKAFREAAELGLNEARRALAWICLYKTPNEAIGWLRMAADNGDALSQFDLGLIYERGTARPRDRGEALKYFRKAAEQGDPRGQYYVGRMYENGNGVAKDTAEAVRWFGKAAESDDAFLLNHLAWSLATSEDPESRNGRDAVRFAQRVIELSKRRNPFYLDTLAAAYAEAGQFDKAASVEKEAEALVRDEPLKKNFDFETRLKVYEARLPYRDVSQKEQTYP